MTSLSSLTLCALSSQWAWRRLGRDAERLFSVSAWSGNKAKRCVRYTIDHANIYSYLFYRSRKFRIDNLADLQGKNYFTYIHTHTHTHTHTELKKTGGKVSEAGKLL